MKLTDDQKAALEICCPPDKLKCLVPLIEVWIQNAWDEGYSAYESDMLEVWRYV